MDWDDFKTIRGQPNSCSERRGREEPLLLQYTDRFTAGVKACSVAFDGSTPVGLLGVDMTKRSPVDA
jgi:hypothetical protein